MEGAAFSSAVRMLSHEGRDPYFTKRHPLHEEIRDIKQEIKKVTGSTERIARQSEVRQRAFASVTPRRYVVVEKMLDLSEVLSEHDIAEGRFTGTVFEMPDGTYWEIPLETPRSFPLWMVSMAVDSLSCGESIAETPVSRSTVRTWTLPDPVRIDPPP